MAGTNDQPHTNLWRSVADSWHDISSSSDSGGETTESWNKKTVDT